MFLGLIDVPLLPLLGGACASPPSSRLIGLGGVFPASLTSVSSPDSTLPVDLSLSAFSTSCRSSAMSGGSLLMMLW